MFNLTEAKMVPIRFHQEFFYVVYRKFESTWPKVMQRKIMQKNLRNILFLYHNFRLATRNSHFLLDISYSQNVKAYWIA